MKGALLKEVVERNSTKKLVIVQVFQSGSNRTRQESYREIPISAEAYGYESEELLEIINKKLSQ